MRSLLFGLVWLAALSAASDAAGADPELAAPIRQFIDSFNKADMTAAAATHTADAVIIDEPAPHLWSGPGAFNAWGVALGKDSAARGRSGESVAIGAATREEVAGDSAYVIVPATYAFKEKGVSMREVAQMTFVLKREAGDWKIAGWAWTGPRASAAK